MTTTAVGDILEEARDAHPAFDRRQVTDRALLRALSGYHRGLCAKVGLVNEDLLATEVVITLPLTSFAAGYTLPAHQYIHGADVWWSNGVDKSSLRLVPWSSRHDPGRFPCAYIHGGVLYLLGIENDWLTFGSIRLSHTPAAVDFTVLSDTILLPPEAGDACVAFLALFMANRGCVDKALPPINLPFFVRQSDAAEQAFLNDVAMRRGHLDNKVREVRSYS